MMLMKEKNKIIMPKELTSENKAKDIYKLAVKHFGREIK